MKRRVLQIDDNRDSRVLVQKSLDPEHWQVEACGSDQAMQLASAQPWDVILLEVALIGMSGLVLLQQLQSNSSTCAIPVILLTSRVTSHEVEHYYQFKIAGVIAKPFVLRRLPLEISLKLDCWNYVNSCASFTSMHRVIGG